MTKRGFVETKKLFRRAGVVQLLCLGMAGAVATAAQPAEAKFFKLPHFKKHESKPKVSRVDETTLAITADEPGSGPRAIRAAAEATLADGYDHFEVVSDVNAIPIAIPGESTRTMTIFVKMSRSAAATAGQPNIYDARAVLLPAAAP